MKFSETGRQTIVLVSCQYDRIVDSGGNGTYQLIITNRILNVKTPCFA